MTLQNGGGYNPFSSVSIDFNENRIASVIAEWVLIVTEISNIAVNYFYTQKSARYSRLLVVSGTQCNLRNFKHGLDTFTVKHKIFSLNLNLNFLFLTLSPKTYKDKNAFQ